MSANVRTQSSIADQGCLFRIPDPDFFPSRIPDLGSRIQKQQQKRWIMGLEREGLEMERYERDTLEREGVNRLFIV
jgi:hypothetical protein